MIKNRCCLLRLSLTCYKQNPIITTHIFKIIFHFNILVFPILSKQNVGFLILSAACWIFVGFLLNCLLIPMFHFFRWIKHDKIICVLDFYVIFLQQKFHEKIHQKCETKVETFLQQNMVFVWIFSRAQMVRIHNFCMDFFQWRYPTGAFYFGA